MKAKKAFPIKATVTVAVLLILAVGGGWCLKTFAGTQDVYAGLYTVYCEGVQTEEKSVARFDDPTSDFPSDFLERFRKLYETNPAVVGWLDVENTGVHFPVVQDEKKDWTVLDFTGKDSGQGTPYLDPASVLESVEESTNKILYLDGDRDGRWISEFKKYLDVGYYRAHPTISFTTVERPGTWKVISAYVTDSKDFDCRQYHLFLDREELEEYIDQVRRRSAFDTSVNVAEGDELLTVTAPTDDFEGARLVVTARLVRNETEEINEHLTATVNRYSLQADAWYALYGGEKPRENQMLSAAQVMIERPSSGGSDDSFMDGPQPIPWEDTSSQVTSSEEPSSSEESSQKPSSEETSSQTTSSKETSSAASSKETSSKEPSSAVTSSKETSSKETSSKETSSKETSSKETSSKETSSKENSSKPTPSQEPSSEKPSSEEPSREPSSEPESSEDTSSEDTSSEEKPPKPSLGDEELTVYADGWRVTDTAYNIVCQIVANEMNDSCPDEALKAQAVAAHTFVVYHNSINWIPSVGFRTPSQRIKNLVAEVIDELVYYNGKPIYAAYFSISAGRTNTASEVWGGRDYPYIQSVESKYDYLVRNYEVSKRFSRLYVLDTIRDRLNITLEAGDEDWWFRADTLTGAGYVSVMNIGGQTTYTNDAGSTAKITGTLMRSIFGLRSTHFSVEYDAESEEFVFTVQGYGHGVGMSQHGAIQYVNREGWDYKQILKHYYTDVDVY